MMAIPELIWGLVGFLLTIMVLSYLIGDNLFFRLAAYLFIGVTAGFLTVLIFNQILWPYLLQPLISGSWEERVWVFVPMVLSFLLIASQFPRLNTAGRMPLAFLAGLTGAIAVGGAVFGTIIPQMQAVVNGFDASLWGATPAAPWMRILEAAIMLIGVISTLSFFHFGRRAPAVSDSGGQARPLVFEALAKIGQIFIGLALGAVFAGIFSSALIAMIDRLVFMGQMIGRLIGGG